MVMSIQRKRKYQKFKIFNDIFEKVKIRINHYTKFGQTSCYYEIPYLIYGCPHINMKEISEYIESKLRKEGFVIIRLNPTVIYISWEESIVKKQREINNLRFENKEHERLVQQKEFNYNEELLRNLSDFSK